MKLHVRLLEKWIEIPECLPETASRSQLRHTLDDIGLEVKSVDVSPEKGVVFTIETLANRGDHLSVYGVARELAARTLAQIKLPTLAAKLSERKASLPVRRVTEKCTRYALLEMSLPADMPLRNDVAAFTEEPGKHPAIVAILNYVQMEFGQPMHAFDAEKIDGEIIIDLATKVEEIEALDGKSYKVPEGAILIRDRKKIVAVAGVIGCANSMVTATTRKVYIEAAVFDPTSVRITARAMGLGTEASHAFERGVDPEGIQIALKRLVTLAEGSAGSIPGAESAHALGLTYLEAAAPEKRKVVVTLNNLRRELNMPRLEEVEIVARLKHLGYGVEATTVGKDREFSLVIPSWRLLDCRNREDIVEDVARSVSLNRVRNELPALDYDMPAKNPIETISQRVRAAVIGNGFFEVITKGFYSAADVALLEGLHRGYGAQHIALKNSLEQSNSHMKATNVIHLTKLLAVNRKRGVRAPKVFELCRLFTKPGELPSDEPRDRDPLDYNFERDVLCLAAAGRWTDIEWRKGESLEEYARLFKGAVAAIIKSLGCEFSVGKSENRFLHPGMQASIKMGRSVVGYFGVVHPTIREACDLREEAFFAEFDLRLVYKLMSKVEAPSVSDLPPISRDLTLKIDLREQAGRVIRILHELNLDSVAEASIIDDFRKQEESFRRVTYRVTFQRLDRTLKHEEVDAAIGTLLETLRAKHGIEMML
jgi:phenylalanyl-tRNA synthetase beta chain